MILDGILDKIGFTEEMQKECNAYIAKAGNCIDEIAESFMKGDNDIKSVMAELDSLAINGMNNYTRYLLFFLSCTGPLYDQYFEKGYYETDIFHDAWRFFGKDAGKDVLPTKTSLQRKFVEYIGPGKTYGYGKGIFLFDGENIIK